MQFWLFCRSIDTMLQFFIRNKSLDEKNAISTLWMDYLAHSLRKRTRLRGFENTGCVQTGSHDTTTGRCFSSQKCCIFEELTFAYQKEKEESGSPFSQQGSWFIIKDLKDSIRVHCIGVLKISMNTGLIFDDNHQFAIIFREGYIAETCGRAYTSRFGSGFKKVKFVLFFSIKGSRDQLISPVKTFPLKSKLLMSSFLVPYVGVAHIRNLSAWSYESSISGKCRWLHYKPLGATFLL